MLITLKLLTSFYIYLKNKQKIWYNIRRYGVVYGFDMYY